MTKTHLDRVRSRDRDAKLKSRAVVSLTLGTALALIGFYRYLFVPHVDDRVWFATGIVGLVTCALGVVVPDALFWLDDALHWVGNIFGKAVLGAVLAICYAFITLLRPVIRRRYEATFLAWSEGETPNVTSAWRKKELAALVAEKELRRRPLLIMPILVIRYFARQKQYILIPVLLIMILFGLLLFFLQTSVLAPFIYTLF